MSKLFRLGLASIKVNLFKIKLDLGSKLTVVNSNRWEFSLCSYLKCV